MPTHGLEAIESSLQKTNIWLHEINARLGSTDRHRAWLALGTVLHLVRDRLPVVEAVQLGAQLPLVVRGLYFTGWDANVNPVRERSKEDFLDHVRAVFQAEPEQAETITAAVISAMCAHLSSGEMADIFRALPAGLREHVIVPMPELEAEAPPPPQGPAE